MTTDIQQATPNKAQANVFPSLLNLINNILGAGLFSMPWCLRQASLGSGVVLLIFCACLNAASFVIIAKCCDLAHEFSYLKMGRIALGNTFGLCLQGVVALYTLGSTISFVVLCGDFLVGKNTGVFEHFANNTILYNPNNDTGSRAFIILICTVLFFLPLSVLRHLDGLKYTSAVSCLASFYAAVLTCTVYFNAPADAMLEYELKAQPPLRDEISWFAFRLSFWEAVPIVNVAFTAHYNAGRFYQELSNRSTKRIAIVSYGAMGLSLLLYGVVAVAGYLTFGRETKGNILENYAPGYALAIGARIALATVVIFTLPLAAHSLRGSLFALLWKDGNINSDNAPRSIIAAIAVGVLLGCGTVGVLFTKIEVVLAYKGGIFGSCLVYIFPSLMLVALRVRRDRHQVENATIATRLVPRAFDGEENDRDNSPPATFRETLVAMFTQKENWYLGFMFLWGILGGLLSVSVTVLKQIGVLV